ncbi:MAG: winged helix-turn-helix domain-containing protein [Candidatus Eremiobacteraeota bacterium]|nr:winged helix-turn-helix domain-containing protein [Candidatus Eremiobacteraeota bacterium]
MATYLFGPYQLDTERRSLSLGAKDLAVGSKLVDTLLALVERAGHVCTTQQLLDRIWPEGYTDPASLRQNVYILRKLLREHWDQPVIENVPRTGYRFVARLRTAPAPEPNATPGAIPFLRRPLVRMSALAACVVLAIGVTHSSGPARVAPVSLNAQDARLYALGRYYWDTRTRDGLLKSVKYFRLVASAEPRNALGYTGLSDAYFILGEYHYGTQKEQTYYRWASRNADKAYALDPDLSEVRTSRANIFDQVHKDVKAARAEYERAIELNPSNAVAHLWYGVLLYREDQVAAGHDQLEAAEQLDPTAPAVSRWLAMDDYLNRRYERAIALYRQTLDLSPSDDEAAVMLGLAYEGMHDYPAALRSFKRAEKICSCVMPLALEARTLALMGLTREANIRLVESQRVPKGGEKVEPLAIAVALIALGQRDRAIDWIKRSTSDSFAAVFLRLDPRLDAVRNDPRFGAILGKTVAVCSLNC